MRDGKSGGKCRPLLSLDLPTPTPTVEGSRKAQQPNSLWGSSKNSILVSTNAPSPCKTGLLSSLLLSWTKHEEKRAYAPKGPDTQTGLFDSFHKKNYEHLAFYVFFFLRKIFRADKSKLACSAIQLAVPLVTWGAKPYGNSGLQGWKSRGPNPSWVDQGIQCQILD